MRPYPEEIILALQRGVSAHFLPELKSSYAQAQFMPAQLLFGIALRESDTAAQDLVDANRELRELIAEVASAIAQIEHPDAVAAREVAAGLPQAAADIKLSSLRSEFDALRAMICGLVPVVEPACDHLALAPLVPVRERIYGWLAADAKKRAVPILNH